MIVVDKSAWILITGNIRDELFLLRRLKFFSELKKLGFIEGIVFSTWKGEVEKFPSIYDAVNAYDITLVESVEPDIVCLGHYVHQMITLKNGLDVCPDHQFILRSRTDKCGAESGFIEDEIASFIKNKDYVKACHDEFGIFNYKIGTFRYHTTVSNNAPALFFWNDAKKSRILL